MKSKLLTALFLCLALGVSAQESRPHAVQTQLKKMQSARVVETKTLENGLKVNIRETADGYRFKQVAKPENVEYVSTKNHHVSVAKRTPAEKAHWMESFEAWDGTDASWLPEGWARHTNDSTYLKTGRTWFVNSQSGIYTPAPVDGNYYMEILFNASNTQNEWLDTPALTPQTGDYFTFYFIAQPFGLFDMTKYDSKLKDFTERIQMWDFQVYMQVDGGSWERIYSFWEEFKDSDAYEMRMEQSYNGPRTIKIAKDMASYVGHSVKFRFRYTGQDGDSMFFDYLEMGKPYVTAGYSEPSRTCNFGMTQDYKTPVNWAYYPDSIPMTWTNASSSDATDFLWTYEGPTAGQTGTATTRNLTMQFNHVPETVGHITNANVFACPRLTASREGYQSDTYGGSTEKFKVGGKTYVNVDGTEYHCGAGTYFYDQGMTALTTSDGYPICGYKENTTSEYWYDINGVSSDDYEIKVIGLYNTFSTPDKAYKIRGLWIHGIGEIERKNNLTVTIHTLDEDGAINETPLATAYLDYDSIQTYASAKADLGIDYPYITLPFLFADPVEINQFILVRLNGISDDGVVYFAPIQSRIPDENGSCHGYLRMTATPVTGGTTNTGITPLSDVESDLGSCYASFYMTLDMAYGDCDDWGHLDVRGGNSMLKLENGHLQKYEPTSTDGLYDRLVKAAFYDTSTSFNTSLYVCVGALEQGDDPKLTNHIRIQMPKLSFGREIDLSSDPVTTVAFYNCMNATYYTASEGTLFVTKTDNGYDVSCDCYDEGDDMYFGTIYQDGAWMDASVKKVVPNDLRVYYVADSIHSETDDLEEYTLRSAVMNTTNTDQYIIYLAVQEGIDTEEKMLALEGEPAVIIKAPKNYLADYYYGYSMLYNEYNADSKKISITFRGVEYTPENVFGVTQTGNADDAIAKGGTVYGVLDASGKLQEIEAFVSSATALNGRCMKAHYNSEVASAIKSVSDTNKTSVRYNLAGQRVNGNYRGIVLQNGKKFMK